MQIFLNHFKGVLEILCHSSNIQSKRNDTCPSPSDFDKALKVPSPAALTGKDGILTPLIKQLISRAVCGTRLSSGFGWEASQS